jgi:hypothetical protein
MSKGPQLRELKLTAQENNQLIEWTRRHKTSQALALRARIILACAQGENKGRRWWVAVRRREAPHRSGREVLGRLAQVH